MVEDEVGGICVLKVDHVIIYFYYCNLGHNEINFLINDLLDET